MFEKTSKEEGRRPGQVRKERGKAGTCGVSKAKAFPGG